MMTDLDEAFWARFEKKIEPDPISGCLNWTGANFRGYGRIGLGSSKVVAAHRVAYERKFGAIPDGNYVCHKCDNTRCVNPDHLFVGSQADNIRDMVAKGRNFTNKNGVNFGTRGTKNCFSKLTENDVRRIKADVRPQRVIAKSFRVNQSVVSKVKSNKAWAWVK
jgi:hypothetical protein